MAKTLRALSVAVLCAVTLTACLETRVGDRRTVAPPETGVTEFGSAFSMDEGRLVVRALRNERPVLYVYDATGDGGWTHSATIEDIDGTRDWGSDVAVSGDTIAVKDSGVDDGTGFSFGGITIYDLVDGTWTMGQSFGTGTFESFGGMWLTGDSLLIRSPRGARPSAPPTTGRCTPRQSW